MPIEDGNEDPNTPDTPPAPPAVQQPVINEDRIVQKLFDRFQQNTQRDTTPAEKNALVSIYHDLKAKGMDDDFIASQLGIAKTIEDAVLNKVAKGQVEQARQQRDSEAYKVIGKFIREYSREDDRVGELETVIRSKVAEKFNADPERLAEWKNFVVNESAIEKIVDSVVGDVSKRILGTDQVKPGPAVKAKTSSTVKGGDGNAEGGSATTSGPRDVSSLNEDQQEYYYTRLSNIQRWQGKPRAEAEKLAFEQARALPKYNPKAVH